MECSGGGKGFSPSTLAVSLVLLPGERARGEGTDVLPDQRLDIPSESRYLHAGEAGQCRRANYR